MKPLWDPVSYRSKRYLENLLSLGIISVLAVMSLAYIDRITVAAEQASVQQTLSALRQGVQFFMLGKIVSDDRQDLESYHGSNPFAMLSNMPPHYAGEYSAQEGMQVPAGRWYFELDSRQAVYRFMNRLLWKAGEKEIRLSLQFKPADGDDALPLKLLELRDSIEEKTGEN